MLILKERSFKMKTYFMHLMLFFAVLIISSDLAYATKPGEQVNPNGFPSGEHYNLNIHGKKAEFTCPGVELDEFGNPIYGNSIFLILDGAGEILMESGSGKGKRTESVATLQVT